MTITSHVSTGWDNLDMIIDHLRRGDNVVWQVDSIDDYQRLVSFFVASSVSNNDGVVYMRFARHAPLLKSSDQIMIYNLNIDQGFESFSSQVHNIIKKEGNNTHYVFDSLSDLLHVWATDLMIGDFFYITCPYLFELNTIAYFAIQRNMHSFKAIARIRETTQVLIDVYNYKRQICIHPLKVQQRYSPTMFFPHVRKKNELIPVINSVEATQLFSHLSRQHHTTDAQRHLDYWDRLFLQAKNLLNSQASTNEKLDMVEQLARFLLSRNKRVLSLIRKYFLLEDLLWIKERLIGTGFLGGKALGMLLARKILIQDTSFQWNTILEHHDSFYIGSDVFYSYIVQNGWWKLFMAHKTREGYFEKAFELKSSMLKGIFPEEIKEQFKRMLEYFGQSPIIVRSSSLLEDAFGSAFSGKYESFFCVNQGSPETRYQHFEEAVKKIFASTMNEDALVYRLQRGLDQQNEQMAILVQRVSGAYREQFFFPEIAGVGLSHNPFVWKKDMNPKAGMLRLVFGLGTRAVNRVDTDYPRIVAVDEPLVRPLSEMKDIRKFSQNYVDVLNLEDNQLQTVSVRELARKGLDTKLNILSIRDTEAIENLRAVGKIEQEMRILTFDPFLTDTAFIKTMAKMLQTLESGYQYPVDIEFTVNFNQVDKIQINLLQCRPFQTFGEGVRVEMPDPIHPDKVIIQTEGNFMGGNVSQPIAGIIFVDPQEYVALSLSDKYSVARLIGRLNRQVIDRVKMPTLLLGPGRWGTHSPAMGIPVTFSEINHIIAMAEISYKDGSLIPDLSFGTHFFQDLVETRIFYLAVYPEKSGVVFNRNWFQDLPNMLEMLCPGEERFSSVVKVCDIRDKNLILCADITTQKMLCYLS
ncbi:MAG: phosphoenolpyruvate synthase [Desulfobacterium sp.]|nr:phosphoenolpyruvate synthase [Desulfobacterium sp.]